MNSTKSTTNKSQTTKGKTTWTSNSTEKFTPVLEELLKQPGITSVKDAPPPKLPDSYKAYENIPDKLRAEINSVLKPTKVTLNVPTIGKIGKLHFNITINLPNDMYILTGLPTELDRELDMLFGSVTDLECSIPVLGKQGTITFQIGIDYELDVAAVNCEINPQPRKVNSKPIPQFIYDSFDPERWCNEWGIMDMFEDCLVCQPKSVIDKYKKIEKEYEAKLNALRTKLIEYIMTTHNVPDNQKQDADWLADECLCRVAERSE